MGSGRILVFGADSNCDNAVQALEAAGHEVCRFSETEAALTCLQRDAFDLAIINVDGPARAGIQMVEHVRASRFPAEVLLMSNTVTENPVFSPSSKYPKGCLVAPDNLALLVNRANEAAAANGAAQRQAVPALLGASACMQKLRAQIDAVARHDITVLIQGETGTGKDLVARLLHLKSPRAATGALCKVNCPAIPESLFESEMFGFERGAFTGADKQRVGRFELAHRGTIFLDEIGLLPMPMQAKLLEVLESRSFFRIGGTRPVHADARVVTATNASLGRMAAAGQFRNDLLYRIRIYTLELPPLRAHPEDIPELLAHFLNTFSRRFGQPRRTVPPEALPRLYTYPWPGNVRELEALAARYVVQNDPAVFEALGNPPESGPVDGARDALEEQERRTIKAALMQTGWNQRQAAQLLRISYSAFRRRVRKYNIERPPFDTNLRQP